MLSTFLLKSIPKIISILLHPLLMPVLGIFILFNSGTYISFFPLEFKRSVLLIVGICTLGIPLVFVPFYIYRKIIIHIEMDTSQERIIPLVVTSVLFYASFYLMNNSGVPKTLQVFLLGSTFCVLATLFVSMIWKISAHMIGLGGIVGLIVSITLIMHCNVMLYLILFLILSGITATCRLLLNSHSPLQVYTGFALGFFVMTFTLFIF